MMKIRWAEWYQTGGASPYTYVGDCSYSIKRFQRFIQPGDLVVDIGAYCGDYTMVFGLLAGPTGKVIAFEPNPKTFRVLQENAALNSDLCDFECHNVAIMGVERPYTFHYGDNSFDNGGFASGLEKPMAQQIVPHNVPLEIVGKRLHGFLPKDRPIGFLKIDTEGWDHHVLESIADVVIRDKPIIMAEVFTDLTDAERLQFRDVVASIGYLVEQPNGHELPDIKHFTAAVAFDVILYPPT